MNQQWISQSTTSLIFNFIKSIPFLFNGRRKNLIAIEEYFCDFFGRKVVLMPSGRSAIHQYASVLGYSRGETAFITKYSSFCMYQSLGTVMNVSSDFHKPDLLVVNHKWGYVNIDPRVSKVESTLEDSCDSLISSPSGLFPNSGQVELISLSKTLGMVSGALVLFNNSISISSKMAQLQNQNKFLGNMQFMRKILRILFPGAFKLALQDEYANTYLTGVELAMIRNSMCSYQLNFKLNSDRYHRIRRCLNLSPIEIERIGPGVVLKFEGELQTYTDLRIPEGIIIRNFDFSSSNDFQAKYQKCFYLPIHGGVSERSFESFLVFIEKNKHLLRIN
jgi:hypothetical protein